MGTWGPHSFDNDVAMDWAGRFRAEGLPLAAATIRDVTAEFLDDRMDADRATEGVAAIEAVAVALGRGTPAAAEALAGAPNAKTAHAEALTGDAGMLITIVAGGGSALRALWEEADWDEREAWLDSLRDLRARLDGDEPAPDPRPDPVAVGTEAMLEDIRKAIGGLQFDIQVLRQETDENFARLARKVEALQK